MKIQYLGYLVIIIAFYAGYKAFYGIAIIPLALISTLIFATARRQSTKGQHHTRENNALADGAFLFTLQLLIIFTVFAMGYFMGSPAGDNFIDFITGRRR